MANMKPKYEVHEIEEEVPHTIWSFDEKTGEMRSDTTQEAGGFMVYFPTGSSIRVRNVSELARLGFNKPPTLVDMETGDEVAVPKLTSLKSRSEQKTSNKGLPSDKVTD